MSATAMVMCQQSAGVVEQGTLLRQGYGGHAGASRFSMRAGARVSWELNLKSGAAVASQIRKLFKVLAENETLTRAVEQISEKLDKE
ncbi:MAG: hypothetical protein PF904_19410 [Kiritimatiellae bacterium]|jgi:hypothetical protein|nr:hypothetical protein [Kiritimatiellia bacterium]